MRNFGLIMYKMYNFGYIFIVYFYAVYTIQNAGRMQTIYKFHAIPAQTTTSAKLKLLGILFFPKFQELPAQYTSAPIKLVMELTNR